MAAKSTTKVNTLNVIILLCGLGFIIFFGWSVGTYFGDRIMNYMNGVNEGETITIHQTEQEGVDRFNPEEIAKEYKANAEKLDHFYIMEAEIQLRFVKAVEIQFNNCKAILSESQCVPILTDHKACLLNLSGPECQY